MNDKCGEGINQQTWPRFVGKPASSRQVADQTTPVFQSLTVTKLMIWRKRGEAGVTICSLPHGSFDTIAQLSGAWPDYQTRLTYRARQCLHATCCATAVPRKEKFLAIFSPIAVLYILPCHPTKGQRSILSSDATITDLFIFNEAAAASPSLYLLQTLHLMSELNLFVH